MALGLTGVLALVGTGAVASYLDLQAQLDVSDVEALLGEDRSRPPAHSDEQDPDDPFAGQALNILVMGTDFRDEENAALAGEGDEFHSDTTLLVHVSGDRSRIEAVSIPRDSLVDIPACPRSDGSTSDARRNTMFNRAFTIGGGDDRDITGAAACTILTVESLTGVGITDHMVVKMSGVIDVVDAIGGVRMCLPEPVKGRKVDLDLPAGEQRFDGYTAINFLRARQGSGMGLEMGSDLGRIERQQAFFDAMLREVLAQNIITDSPRLYRVVREVLQSISTGRDLASPAALAGLAWSMRNIDPAQIVFTSVPVVEAPRNPDRVVWTDEADAIWERIRADEPPPGSPAPSPSASGGSDGASPDGSDASDRPSAPASEEPFDGASEPESGAESGGSAGPTPSPSPSVRPGVCADAA
ncbi:LytR family transcriptional attenuator [Isoptericola variabilis J7]|uniref:Cell envelope-related transcriptional attenuator n=1 Tax=Isoptericola variabilis (strain 225) TaxID=743718 RepID=F6FPZ0_ISOV2|nr:cell envelope-related transcriptional attenuator [Isoptericola variabilis 225]TWH27461.1 LytR family transcriptional attenuator [Isoptericola variabilis J7]